MKKRKTFETAKLILLVLVPVLFALIPTSLIESGPTLCLYRLIFGVRCPGCGMTRAVSAMFHGNISAAIGFNRLIIIVFPLLCVWYVKEMFATVGNVFELRVLSENGVVSQSVGKTMK
jgi:hypothetical protein